MAKGTINAVCRLCGNSFTVSQKFYSRKEADYWEKIYKDQFEICHVCQEKLTEKKREKEHERKMKQVKEAGLPDLEGSLRQINWANEIRSNFWDVYLKKEEFARKEAVNCDKLEYFERSSQRNRSIFMELISSKFYIEHRTASLRNIMQAFLKEKKSS